jgi:hypothetical protein
MRRLAPLILAAAVLGIAALPAAPASAACSQWDASYVRLKQNNGFIVGMPAQQRNGWFNGRVTLMQYGSDWARQLDGGQVVGWLRGRNLRVTIYWDNGGTGQYFGVMGADNRLRGNSQDVYHGNWTNWTAMGLSRCRG